MKNKYLSEEVGQTEFANFFQKLEHSISISRTHGIITMSEFLKAQNRLVKKFISSLRIGKYSAIKDIVISFGDDDIQIKKHGEIELGKVDKANKSVSIVIDEYEYILKFQIMLNFKSK